jgi:hypothetical protein
VPGYLAWGEVVPERLVVDLSPGGAVNVLSWPDGGIPEEVSQASLEWPLDTDALEDLRWYLEDYLDPADAAPAVVARQERSAQCPNQWRRRERCCWAR